MTKVPIESPAAGSDRAGPGGRRFAVGENGVLSSIEGPAEFIVLEPPKVEAAADERFGANIVWLLVLGVSFSCWLYYYTDWFTTFTSLLGLGGILSWVATVGKIVPKASTQALSDRLYRLASSRAMGRWCKGLIVGGALLASCFATIEVRSVQDAAVRRVTIQRDGETVDPEWLAPGERIRWITWAPWFTGRQQMNVKVSGYPTIRQPLRFPQKVEIRLPESVYPPTVLLRSSALMIGLRAENPVTLIVTRGGSEIGRREGFTGESVWVSLESDLELPAAARDRWRDEVAANKDTSSGPRWFNPVSLQPPPAGATTKPASSSAPAPIKPGDVLRVEMTDLQGKSVWKSGDIPVNEIGRRAEFPQVAELKK